VIICSSFEYVVVTAECCVNVGRLACRTAVDFMMFLISILYVMGWDFITMWTYLVSQNESDGGDWEGKVSVASVALCYMHSICLVVVTCWMVWRPFASFMCPAHIVLVVVCTCCKSLNVDKICLCHHLHQFGTEVMYQIDMAYHLKRFYHC
jgi:hypothetical protein